MRLSAQDEDMARALWAWGRLARLMAAGRVRVAGHDPDEVDELAAAVFELVGGRRASAASA
jgi:hypothetical protein